MYLHQAEEMYSIQSIFLPMQLQGRALDLVISFLKSLNEKTYTAVYVELKYLALLKIECFTHKIRNNSDSIPGVFSDILTAASYLHVRTCTLL